MEGLQINYSHPWEYHLLFYKIPQNKFSEFYSLFGEICYANQVNNEAFKWIRKNRAKRSESPT